MKNTMFYFNSIQFSNISDFKRIGTDLISQNNMITCYASKLVSLIISKFPQVQFKRSQSINLHSAKYWTKVTLNNKQNSLNFIDFRFFFHEKRNKNYILLIIFFRRNFFTKMTRLIKCITIQFHWKFNGKKKKERNIHGMEFVAMQQ